MNPDLLKKLQEDLTKSGFASEMDVHRSFLNREWICQPGANYVDKDEGKLREIDLDAMQAFYNDEVTPGRFFEYRALVEVKKSERPWVVFSHNSTADSNDSSFPGWHCTIDHPMESIEAIFTTTSIRSSLGWIGYGIHEAFKDPKHPSNWYAGCQGACKSADVAFDSEYHVQSLKTEKVLFVAQPLIILDGMLCRASLTDAGELLIQEIDWAPLDFEYKSGTERPTKNRVDIVRISKLPDYLEILDKRVRRLCDITLV